MLKSASRIIEKPIFFLCMEEMCGFTGVRSNCLRWSYQRK